MTGNPYRDHLAERVLGADPVELIVLLYEELVRRIGQARRHLAQGDAAGRAEAVSRAMEIVGELAQSVDARADAELAGRLAQLYAFLIEKLQAGHCERRDEPLAACERVARTLLEAWQGISAARVAAVASPAPALQEGPAIQLAG